MKNDLDFTDKMDKTIKLESKILDIILIHFLLQSFLNSLPMTFNPYLLLFQLLFCTNIIKLKINNARPDIGFNKIIKLKNLFKRHQCNGEA